MTEGHVPEQIAYTNRFVATRSTGRSMARAFVRHALTMRSQVMCRAVGFALFFLVWMVLFDEDSATLGARVFWALVLSGAMTIALTTLTLVVSYVRTLRGSRVHLFPGGVVESGFGDAQMFLRNSMAESKISYRSVQSLTTRGDFVFLRHRASPLVVIYPRVLFPDDVVADIRAAAGR